MVERIKKSEGNPETNVWKKHTILKVETNAKSPRIGFFKDFPSYTRLFLIKCLIKYWESLFKRQNKKWMFFRKLNLPLFGIKYINVLIPYRSQINWAS